MNIFPHVVIIRGLTVGTSSERVTVPEENAEAAGRAARARRGLGG